MLHKSHMGDYSDLLFSRPSFIEGCGRILDFGGAMTEFNCCHDLEQADLLAIQSDWNAIEQDLADFLTLM